MYLCYLQNVAVWILEGCLSLSPRLVVHWLNEFDSSPAQSVAEFVHIINDPDDAFVGADAVYVKSWGSVKLFGQPEEEAALRASLRDWRLTPARLKSTRQGKAGVMHCLPVRRNVEIDDAVLDGPNSLVVEEAENRLHVQRALLLTLLASPAALRP